MSLRNVELIVKLLLSLLGALLIVFGVFFYPDERSGWVNRVDCLWVEIDDHERKIKSKTLGLITAVAGATHNIVNRVFGKRLFSLRSVVVSAALSMLMPTIDNFHEFAGYDRLFAFASLTLVVALPVSAISKSKYIQRAAIVALLAAELCILRMAAFFIWISGGGHASAVIALGLVMLAVGSDILVIAFTRWAFARCSRAVTLGPAIAVLTCSILIGVVPILVPWKLSRSQSAQVELHSAQCREANRASLALLSELVVNHQLSEGDRAKLVELKKRKDDIAGKEWDAEQEAQTRSSAFGALAWADVDTAICGITFVLTVGALLLNRLLWPILSRLTYAISYFGLLQNSKLLAGIGATLLLLGMAPSRAKEVVSFILRLFGA
jgi:hypothetical protein